MRALVIGSFGAAVHKGNEAVRPFTVESLRAQKGHDREKLVALNIYEVENSLPYIYLYILIQIYNSIHTFYA